MGGDASGYVKGYWWGAEGRGVKGGGGSYSSELVGRRKVRDGRIGKTGLQRGKGNRGEESP